MRARPVTGRALGLPGPLRGVLRGVLAGGVAAGLAAGLLVLPAVAAAPAEPSDPTVSGPASGTAGSPSGDPNASADPSASASVAAEPADPVAALPRVVRVGTSVQGREIVARRLGNRNATRVVLVLGQIHGSEPAGRRVVSALRRETAPRGVQIWTISTLNPDGARVGGRRNARGVDLNRNFPYNWLGSTGSRVTWPGPRPLSEPESKAAVRFLRVLRPDAILSYHQPFGLIDVTGDKTRAWARKLARWIGLRPSVASCSGPCGGTLTGWYNATFPGWAITVELPSYVSQDLVDRNVAAILRVSTRIVDHP
ncbi:MAG: DUF2817 domain-containing protein [Candidatus Nanopelagicales bacterium]